MADREGPVQQRAEAARLERRLGEIDRELGRLQTERAGAQRRLEELRRSLTMCPKCGRDRDFLADADGVLVHVLEDPQDTDLVEPGKPLFCPRCGEVFLYAGAAPPAVASVAAPARRR